MTRNQLTYWSNKEQARSNLANERETTRSNRAKESETYRHNTYDELVQAIKNYETQRHNQQSERIEAAKVVNQTYGNLSNAANNLKSGLKDVPNIIKSML